VTEDALLFAAALAHPDEDTPRLALADWFDEHDEPALALREGPELVAFLAELTRWDTSPVRALLTVESGAFRELFPALVAARLLTRYMDLFPYPPSARTKFSENAPPPTTPDAPLPPRSFLLQWQHYRRKQIAVMRECAAGDSNKPPHARPVFRALPDARGFEEQSCLLHELVLRGRALSTIPGALDHAAQMRGRGHPLAWLPLTLLAPDAELPPRAMRPRPAGIAPPVPPGAGAPLAPGRAGAPTVVGTEVLELESPVFAAARGWKEESNGMLEGHVFRLDRALNTSAAGSAWFAGLPASALNGPPLAANWTVNRVPGAGALLTLFMAASTGGAYGRREAGAYARLHAWQSLSALAGCALGAPAEDVAAVVDRCEWFEFGGTPWFHQIAWDLGLICVRPDCLSVAVLAATDTD
jgi:uncharacterized protein (TIGR02996 family)